MVSSLPARATRVNFVASGTPQLQRFLLLKSLSEHPTTLGPEHSQLNPQTVSFKASMSVPGCAESGANAQPTGFYECSFRACVIDYASGPILQKFRLGVVVIQPLLSAVILIPSPNSCCGSSCFPAWLRHITQPQHIEHHPPTLNSVRRRCTRCLRSLPRRGETWELGV